MVQRCPFITPDDLAIMLGRSDRSTLARRLAGLRARGLIALSWLVTSSALTRCG